MLNRNYQLETELSPEKILESVKSRIEHTKDSDRIDSFNLVNYRQFTIIDNTIVIDRDPSIATPWRGIGTVKISFENRLGKTVINISIKPYLKLILGLSGTFFTVFSAFGLWVAPSLNMIYFLLFSMAILSIAVYIASIRIIWSLEYFVEAMLKDLDIQGTLNQMR